MMTSTEPRLRRRGLTTLAQAVLPVLYQHRLVSTSQLHRLLQPHTRRPVYLLAQLTVLEEMSLVGRVVRRVRSAGGEHLWYVTPVGREVVEAGREVTARAYRISAEAAASQLQEHTLAAVETGVVMVEWARALGDECDPLSWDPEVAHRIRDGDSRVGDDAVLVPDAVLSYVRHTPGQRRLLTFFVEIDRATMPVARLAAKLGAYTRYRTYVPSPGRGQQRPRTGGERTGREAWRDRYPAFPRVLLVLTGASPQKLANRAADLRALVDADARLQRGGEQRLSAGVTTLEHLHRHGPFAPVVAPLFGDPALTDVLMETEESP